LQRFAYFFKFFGYFLHFFNGFVWILAKFRTVAALVAESVAEAVGSTLPIIAKNI